ncbi:MAG: hypothetical protein QOK44_4308 [Betaproteobacteria bacterium]|nr:hypothetical protein [Betaproteobacteria bacterium]
MSQLLRSMGPLPACWSTESDDEVRIASIEMVSIRCETVSFASIRRLV